MSFQLNLLDPHSGFRVTEDNGRRTYYRCDVGYLPSVTTVLAEKLGRVGLDRWRAWVGEEEADRISGKAKTRGSAVHKLLEDYVLGHDPHDETAMPNVRPLYKQIKRQLDAHVDTIYGSEYLLYSTNLNTAGRTDLIALWDGVPSIIDFKTSEKVKEERAIQSYFLQTTCYGLMVEELSKLKIPQIVVLIGTDFEPEASVFIKPKRIYVDQVFNIFSQPATLTIFN